MICVEPEKDELSERQIYLRAGSYPAWRSARAADVIGFLHKNSGQRRWRGPNVVVMF
jgi:hypothetical protein